MNTTVQFWLLFALGNCFYFLPRYMLDIFHSQFFPLREFTTGTLVQRIRHLLIRKNYDLFRISTDYFVLVFLYPIFLRDIITPTEYFIFLCLWFWLTLLYQTYYHVFHRIYHLDPVFFHDYLMLKTAVQIFIHEFGVKNLVLIILAMVIAVSGAIVNWQLLSTAESATFGLWSYLIISIFGIGALYSMLHYNYSKYPQLTFQSQFQSFIRNLVISRRSKKSLASLTLKYMKQYNVDPNVRLKRKPNLYFIVIESYGQVALKGTFRERYLSYIPALEERLQNNGYHVRSGYTTSPVTGGASWISYTSILYGLNVRNQGVYLTMLKNKFMPEFDSLFHWLKRQGYQTFRLSSLGGYESMEIPYDSYSRLYGIDHWIKYKDLGFTGQHYGFGPSPPDQFAIWKGDEISDQRAGTSPKAMFFITQNSHTPYDSPIEVEEDWASLNDGKHIEKQNSAFWSRPKFEKYAPAIEYQLQYLVDFIVKRGTDNDLFILVGDHQPPSLSMTLDNFDTPMHVICKSKDLVNAWEQYGLVSGMIPDDARTPIKQEALHWALLRSLISTDAQRDATLPEFLPSGIPY